MSSRSLSGPQQGMYSCVLCRAPSGVWEGWGVPLKEPLCVGGTLLCADTGQGLTERMSPVPSEWRCWEWEGICCRARRSCSRQGKHTLRSHARLHVSQEMQLRPRPTPCTRSADRPAVRDWFVGAECPALARGVQLLGPRQTCPFFLPPGFFGWDLPAVPCTLLGVRYDEF